VQKVIIQFENASSLLGERERLLLTRFYQNLPEDYRLAITGYTDDTAPGGTITNDSLAQKRGTSRVRLSDITRTEIRYSRPQGIPTLLLCRPNSTDSGRALNRRAEVVLTSTSTHR